LGHFSSSWDGSGSVVYGDGNRISAREQEAVQGIGHGGDRLGCREGLGSLEKMGWAKKA
jgi:hypothetical protein